MKFSIGQVGKLFNISNDTLRYYDKIGILKATINKENGYRYYYEEDLDKLNIIILGKYFGLPLLEVKKILESENLNHYKNFIEKQTQSINKQIAELKLKQKYLEESKEFLDNLLEFKNQNNFNNFKIYEETLTFYKIHNLEILNSNFIKEYLSNSENDIIFEEECYFLYKILKDDVLEENKFDFYIKENKNNKNLMQKYIDKNSFKIDKKIITGKFILINFYGNEKQLKLYILDLNKYFNKNKSSKVYIQYEFSLPKQNNNDHFFNIILEIKNT